MTSDRHIEGLRFNAIWIKEVLSNFDLFMTNLGLAPTRRSQITIRTFFVELLEIDVLHIWSEIRSAPRDPLVMAQNDPRRARKSYARNVHPRRKQLCLIPDSRRRSSYVRIIRQ